MFLQLQGVEDTPEFLSQLTIDKEVVCVHSTPVHQPEYLTTQTPLLAFNFNR